MLSKLSKIYNENYSVSFLFLVLVIQLICKPFIELPFDGSVTPEVYVMIPLLTGIINCLLNKNLKSTYWKLYGISIIVHIIFDWTNYFFWENDGNARGLTLFIARFEILYYIVYLLISNLWIVLVSNIDLLKFTSIDNILRTNQKKGYLLLLFSLMISYTISQIYISFFHTIEYGLGTDKYFIEPITFSSPIEEIKERFITPFIFYCLLTPILLVIGLQVLNQKNINGLSSILLVCLFALVEPISSHFLSYYEGYNYYHFKIVNGFFYNLTMLVSLVYLTNRVNLYVGVLGFILIQTINNYVIKIFTIFYVYGDFYTLSLNDLIPMYPDYAVIILPLIYWVLSNSIFKESSIDNKVIVD